MKVLTYLEDKLIMWLTAICWWFDLHFDLKSKDLANPFMVLVGFLFFCIDSLNFFGNIYVFTGISFFFIINNLLIGKIIYKRSSQSPNPNKHDWFFKIVIFVSSLVSFVMVRSFISFVFLLMLVSWFYVLCTEPMPPAEKEKRKNKKSLKNLELSSQL